MAPGPLDPRAALSFCGARTLLQGARQGSYLLRQLTAGTFARQIDELYSRYDWQVNYTQLNLLDSHDTARALWLMGDDQSALGLCVLLQMTMPGAPCIYDGDEIGLRAAQAPPAAPLFPRRTQVNGTATCWRSTAGPLRCGITLPPCARGPFSACMPRVGSMFSPGRCRNSAQWCSSTRRRGRSH